MFSIQNKSIFVLALYMAMPCFGTLTVTVVKPGTLRASASQSSDNQPTEQFGGLTISHKTRESIEIMNRQYKIDAQLRSDMRDITVGLQGLRVSIKSSTRQDASSYGRYVASLSPSEQRKELAAAQVLIDMQKKDD